MDILEKLFDSAPRVKIMRLFLFNPDEVFEAAEVRGKAQVIARNATREIARLSSIGFIKQKTASKQVYRRRGNDMIAVKKKIRGWTLNERFPYLEQLKGLLISSVSFQRAGIIRRFQNTGRVKLLVISGVFLRNEHSRVDLLLVGDNLKRNAIAQALKGLEAGVGKELRYAILGTEDFTYRYGIYDKFLRDVFDYPHEKLVDKIGIRQG